MGDTAWHKGLVDGYAAALVIASFGLLIGAAATAIVFGIAASLVIAIACALVR